jgi:hypothetical protein
MQGYQSDEDEGVSQELANVNYLPVDVGCVLWECGPEIGGIVAAMEGVCNEEDDDSKGCRDCADSE